MPTTSDTVPQAIFLETDGGVAAVYATKADFLTAGWDLTWQDATGADLATQPTWTLSAGEANGRHVIGWAPAEGLATVKVTAPAGYRSDPAEFSVEASVYSLDDLYGVMSAGLATPVTDLTTTDATDIYDEDSIVLDFSVLEAALTALGAASLADCDTIEAEIKRESQNSGDAADVATLTESILSDTSGNRVVRAVLDTFPVILAVPDGSDQVVARADLRLTKGARTLTVATRELTIRWKAST